MTRGGSFGPHQQMARTSKLKKSSVKSFLVPENNRFELVIKKTSESSQIDHKVI
jgi:hypothetical protein